MELSEAKRFQDLLTSEVVHPHYQFDRLFCDEGMIARSLSKKKFKLLKGIDAVLSRILYEDETVDFLTWGVQSSLVEAYFLGWVMYYLNRTAIVLTSHRILMLRIDGKNRPRDLVRQLRYEAVENVKRTWLGGTCVRTRDGKQATFEKLPKQDRKFVQNVIAELSTTQTESPPEVRSFEDLCPHCYEPVYAWAPACPHCNGGFKSPRRAALLSLAFPGLGDWYLGHRGFAAMELFGAALVWTGYLIAFLIPVHDEFGRDIGSQSAGETLITGVVLLGLMHGIDAFVTRRIARAGLYPGPAAAVPVE